MERLQVIWTKVAAALSLPFAKLSGLIARLWQRFVPASLRDRIGALAERFPLREALLYSAFTTGIFFVSLLLFFPNERIEKTLEEQISAQLEYNIAFDGLSFYWLTGVEVTGLSLVNNDPESKEIYPILQISNAHVRANVLPLLLGDLVIDFYAELYGGAIAGKLTVNSNDVEIALEVADIELGDYPKTKEWWQIGATGKVNANVQYSAARAALDKGAGRLDLSILPTTLDDQLFLKTAMDLGKVTANFKIENGDMIPDPFEIKGQDLTASATGKISLRQDFLKSPLSLETRFELGGELEKKLGAMLPMLSGFGFRKEKDGAYTRKLSGQIGRPR